MVVQVRVDFDPKFVAPKHTHPGPETESTLTFLDPE